MTASVPTGPISPTPQNLPIQKAPEARAFSHINREMSRRYNALPKSVVSDRGPVAADNPWVQTTTVIPRAQAARWVTGVKQEHGGDVVVESTYVERDVAQRTGR